MADLPAIQSYNQILGNMVNAVLSKIGGVSMVPGSPFLSILEAAAQSDFRDTVTILQALNSWNLDFATGISLLRLGRAEGVEKIPLKAASGKVSIIDSSFTKIATKLYQGLASPIVGTSSIYVSDAAEFPTAGYIYIGRNTPSYEGPLEYTSKTDNGNYWTLTLSSPTVKFHNNTESVILAQGGNRPIGTDSLVRTPQANITTSVSFRFTYPSVIIDGETTIENVSVIAETPGTIGNVGANAIKEFVTVPFAGATVINTAPFTNGTDLESDDSYRNRIKEARASRIKGTSLAITNSAIGITSPDENKTITSSSLVKRGSNSTLYIDDGTGYEEITQGAGIEVLTASAVGGEDAFETTFKPIAKAYLLNVYDAPYMLSDEKALSVRVGGVVSTHYFDDSEFIDINNASAYETASSINGNPNLLFSARTLNSGRRVVLFAKAETNEDIEVISIYNDANEILGFSSGVSYTTELYKNDIKLNKDGKTAVVYANDFGFWNALSGNQTLIISIDGTPSITFTFTSQDFIDNGTLYNTIGKNSIDAWISVINAKVPGITAGVDNGVLFIKSNKGANSQSAIEILGGTLVDNKVFNLDSDTGVDVDYYLDRNSGRIKLVTPLAAGDKLSLGSLSSRAFIQSGSIPTTTLASDTYAWLNVDGAAEIINNGTTNASTITTSANGTEWGHRLTLTIDSSTAFLPLNKGDWGILWDSAFNSNIKGAWRLSETSNNNIVIDRRQALTARGGHISVVMVPVGSDISRVMSIGGFTRSLPNSNFGTAPVGVVSACEIYDPNTQLSSVAGSMTANRAYHCATTCDNGKIFVAGGIDDTGTILASTELYDPSTDSWTAKTALTSAVSYCKSVKLSDGKIFISGGLLANGNSSQACYLYDPTGDTITSAGNMVVGRANHAMCLLPDGKVLISGGRITGGTSTATSEIYDPTGSSFTATGSMAVARHGHSMGLIGTSPTEVLVIGNSTSALHADCETYEKYNIAGGTWGSNTALPSNTAFRQCTIATTQDGSNFVFHGSYTSGPNEVNYNVKADPSAVFTGSSNILYSVSAPQYGVQAVVPYKADNSYLNYVIIIGGTQISKDNGSIDPTASIELFNSNSSTYSFPEPASASVVTGDKGITTSRTLGRVQEIVIPAGVNYTASSISTVINDILDGAKSVIYNTNKLRINTNSHDILGSISLLAQDTEFDNFGFSIDDNVANSKGHVGSVESSASIVKQPSFQSIQIRGESKPVATEAAEGLILSDLADPSYTLVGLRNWYSGKSTSVLNRFGHNYNYKTSILNSTSATNSSTVETRTAGITYRMPYDRAYLAAPFAFTPNDKLIVRVDDSDDKEFNIKLARKLQVVGSTYSQTNTFKDADAGNTYLARTFGLDYAFEDFAVFMKARAVLYSDGGTPTQRMLARYFRFGADGNDTRIRFSNPDGPNASVTVNTDIFTNDTTDIRIKLASGALRTPTVRSTTQIGRVCVSETTGIGTIVYALNLAISSISRAGNVVTVTLSLPSGVTDHGFTSGNVLWLQSSDVNFPTGPVIVTGTPSGITFTYAHVAANAAGGAIGTISFDSQGEATLTGSGTSVGDFFRLNDTTGGSQFFNSTFYITNISANNVRVTSGEQTGYTPSATLLWAPLESTSSLQIFVNPAQTANQIITAVNALAAVDNSTCPITLTVLGAGTGTIVKSTPEFIADSSFWYTLTDGINWVKKTINPPNTSTDYQLTFKNNITGSLSSTSDWANEVVYIVPVTLDNTISWLNTPAVTGLWTVATIESSEDGEKLQISTKSPGMLNGVQVKGGSGNLTTASVTGSLNFGPNYSINTINKSEGDGLTAGQWCNIQNTVKVPKPPIIDSTTELTSLTASGFITTNTPLFTIKKNLAKGKVLIEKQGDWVAISDFGVNSTFNFNTVTDGDYIRLFTAASPSSFDQISSSNIGIFKIVRVHASKDESGGTVWIKNSNVIEETCECGVQVFSANSILPGDILSINTNKWGSENQGLWEVETVGTSTDISTDYFTDTSHIKLSTASRAPQSIASVSALGSSSQYIQVIEPVPGSFIMKITGIVPNQVDGSFLDIKWDASVNNSDISKTAGSIINISNKLGFDTAFSSGADGYNYDIGLIGEANKVIYGDTGDPATYPGVLADGGNVYISGPLVKRIQIGLGIRVRTPATEADIKARVRSAVASVINRSPVGKSIAISDIVSAAQAVVGVVAVSIISPDYNISDDLIRVAAYEKAFILNLDQDIQILIIGD